VAEPGRAGVKDTVDSLVGPGQLIGDMYVWDVRSLPA
jgi:hypothetical protein